MQKFKLYIGVGILLALSGVFAVQTYTHCQIPCGIYGDETRFALMEEHLQTIEKSMVQIGENSDPLNGNQLVRWVNNKEQHADEFTHIVTYYFLAQRIKPTDGAGRDAYLEKLEMLHKMVVLSMNCKQTTDTENVGKLRELVKDFKAAYFKE